MLRIIRSGNEDVFEGDTRINAICFGNASNAVGTESTFGIDECCFAICAAKNGGQLDLDAESVCQLRFAGSVLSERLRSS